MEKDKANLRDKVVRASWCVLGLIVAFILISNSAFASDLVVSDASIKVYQEYTKGNVLSNMAYGLVKDDLYGRKYQTQCLAECDMPIKVKYSGTFTSADKQMTTDDISYSIAKGYGDIKNIKVEYLINETYSINEHTTILDCQPAQSINGTKLPDTCTDKGTDKSVTKWRMIWSDKPPKVIKDNYFFINLHARINARVGMNSMDLVPDVLGTDMKELAWWNSSWRQCIPFNVTNLTSNRMQVPLRINFTTLNFSSTNEIRIVLGTCTNASTLVPYQVITNTSSSAEIMILYNDTMGLTQYSIFYNNSVAPAVTYPNILLFNDSFDQTSCPNYKYWKTGDSAKYSCSGGKLIASKIDGGAYSTDMIQHNVSYPNDNLTIYSNFRDKNTASGGDQFNRYLATLVTLDTWANDWELMSDSDFRFRFLVLTGGTDSTWCSQTKDASIDYTAKMFFDQTNDDSFGQFTFMSNDTNICNHTATIIPNGVDIFGVFFADSGTNDNIEFYDFEIYNSTYWGMINKSNANNPTITIGSPEKYISTAEVVDIVYNSTVWQNEYTNITILLNHTGNPLPPVSGQWQQSIYANLSWNGTYYPVNFTQVNQRLHLFTTILKVPNITNYSESVLFLLNYTSLSENSTSESFVTQDFQQTIMKPYLGLCDATANQTMMNITFFNEDNRTDQIRSQLDLTIYAWNISESSKSSASYNFSGNTSYILCKVPGASFEYDLVARYYNSTYGYLPRYYFIDNSAIGETVRNISMLTSNNSNLADITFNLYTQITNPSVGSILEARRYYPESNTYEIVAMGKTSSRGSTMIPLERSSGLYYDFIALANGVVLKQFTPQVLTSTVLSLYLNDVETPSFYKYWDKVAVNCAISNVTMMAACSLIDTSGEVQNATMEVWQVTNDGLVSVCNNTQIGASQTLQCNVSSTAGKVFVQKLVGVQCCSKATNYTWWNRIVDFTSQVGADLGFGGILGGILLFIACVGIGLYDTNVALILGVVGLIAITSIGLIAVPVGYVIGMVTVMLIMLWWINR